MIERTITIQINTDDPDRADYVASVIARNVIGDPFMLSDGVVTVVGSWYQERPAWLNE